MKAETLLEALNHTLTKHKSRNSRRYSFLVKAKLFANALADRLAEVKAISVGETMTDVNCALQL